MAKITLDAITSGFQSTSQVNNNNTDIANNFNNLVLYRNNPVGEPNEMLNLLDMNSQRIINLPDPVDPTDPVRLQDIGNVIIVDGTPIIIPQNETITLTSGQTEITFSVYETDFAAFIINGLDTDTGRLLNNTDYVILNTTDIRLTDSYPTGTTITLMRNSINGTIPVVIADDVAYDNATSGLTALTVQDAIDEIDSTVDTLSADVIALEDNEFTIVAINTLATDTSRLAANTSSSGITITLPITPSVGDLVRIVDYSGTFLANNCIVARNSSNIMGLAEDMNLNTSFLSVTFNFVDATRGWIMI